MFGGGAGRRFKAVFRLKQEEEEEETALLSVGAECAPHPPPPSAPPLPVTERGKGERRPL